MTPGLHSLFPFAAFWFVAVLTPGPNTLLFTWVALSQDRRTVLALIAGILSCGLLWALGGLFGLVWFMRSFPGLFQFLQIAGGLYIGWRGVQLIRQFLLRRSQPDTKRPKPGPIAPGSAFRMGFLTNLSNPKTLAFVASLFATTSVAQGPLWLGLLGVVIMVMMSASYYLGLYALFSRPRFLNLYRNSQHAIEAGAGAIFMLFGAELLLRGFALA